MVWYGMVWYGTVWYGMVQYGTVWLYLASMAALQAKGVVSRAVYREERQGQQLRDILTYSISGLLAKQDCASRAFCEFGQFFQDLHGTVFFFLALESALPPDWSELRAALNLVEEGARAGRSCAPLACSMGRWTRGAAPSA